jgi:poly(3-hydroxyalkanoate) synthetase
MIDFVLEKTGQKTVSYLGHSQGTTLMFTALAQGFGDLGNKINLFIALAPVVYFEDVTDILLKYTVWAFSLLQQALYLMNINEVFDKTWDDLSGEFCSSIPGICD